MVAYLLAFVLLWPQFSASDRRGAVLDVASTDASPLEALTLLNIAALESGFYPRAVGRHGERGRFQVMPPAPGYGAREALRRLRALGIFGYMGCSSESLECQRMAANRQALAIMYASAFPFEDATRLASE